MDYKIKFMHYCYFIFLAIFIAGCDVDVSPEPLTIIGTPPEDMYYDSNFEYTFGASGGDGKYRYRYIQNPELDDEDSAFEDNPVDMTIEIADDAKASFVLRGTPAIPSNISFEELNDSKHKYRIELTDGNNIVTRDFEFTLKKNTLNFLGEENAVEGVVNNQVVEQLNNLLALDNTSACNQVKDNALTKRINEAGETVYPFAFQVITDARTSSRVELFYRFTTSYQDTLPERSDRNIGHARKGVDYVDEERSIILEANKARCIAYIELYEDFIIEGEESLSIEFYKAVGGAIDFSPARKTLAIRDNEIRPNYLTSNVVRNRGDKVVIPITLSSPLDYPVSLNVSIDLENTTATPEDFTLEPQGGVVSLAPGEIEATYTVALLENANQNINEILKDKIITITTDLDEILDVEPYTIEINEWARTSNISNEIIGGINSNEQVIDFVIDNDGIITTLISDTLNGNTSTKLESFNRDASKFNFTTQGSATYSQVGQDIKPISIEVSSEGADTDHRLAVILSVKSLYGDVFRGGEDFVVMTFTRNTGEPFNLESVKQYGSEGNDQVEGTDLRGSTLYVYGKTNGSDFEGTSSNQTNSGGNDGFIYAINLQNNIFNWAKLVGTNNEDNVTAIDVGNRDIVASISTLSSDEDVLIRRLNLSDGQDVVEELTASITTNRDDRAAAIEFDSSASGFRVLLDSDADISTENELTPTLSRDVQLLTFNSSNEKTSNLTIASELDDTAKSLTPTTDNKNLIIAGETLGELEGNLKRGNGDTDLFTTILELENSSNIIIDKSIQFGTVADDSIISVKPVSNTKYFVLWRESFTSAPFDTFRISAFSIDGKKLSRDP